MFGSEVLEVVIGIIFVFLLVSVICSAIREGIEAWLKTRAAYLEYGIRELLHDENASGLAKSFFEHPVIYSLFAEKYSPENTDKRPGVLANGRNLPSYIPSKNFAQALMDIAARGPETDVVSSDPNAAVMSAENIRMNILNLKNQAVQRVLLMALDSAKGDLDRTQLNIEEWYNSSMDRVSGWYKRSTGWVLFWIGLFVAISMNVNVIRIAQYLYHNDSAREVIVARAQQATNDSTFNNSSYQQAMTDLNSLALPIGWGGEDNSSGQESGDSGNVFWDRYVCPVLGWLFTAFAATMGAPFWFDLLNKIMVIRSTVKPHEKSQEEDSEDRQFPKGANGNNDANQNPPAANPDPGQLRNFQRLSAQQHMISVPSPHDEESGVDSCGGHAHDGDSEDHITKDEDLPQSQGGIA